MSKMAETAVLFALGQVFQFLKEETNLLSGVHRDFSDIKDELESIQVFLKDADRRAADEADTNDGIRTWVKQLREASFRIEDVIDEYLRLTHRANRPRRGSLIFKIASLIKTLTPRHKIALEIQDIKLSIRGIKERSERYSFQTSHEQGSSNSRNSSGESESGRWRDPRMSSLFIEETEIVGLEGPREELFGWLLEGAAKRTVISVVGMGGLGKTTLAKLVYDSQKETEEPLLKMLHKMDDMSLVIEKSFLVHVLNMQLLPPNKAWELFCKKAFRFELDGQCPPELQSMSKEIVRKCKQLPLAIVAIGGLFSTKSKTRTEWQKVSQKLNLELGRNAHLSSLTKILSLSYDGLPYYLKPCILYFGIYPQDYSINNKRLTRQWIAEGFIKSDERRTPEEVAEEYLSELIHRSLVQVSIVEGKIQTCQVHDLFQEVFIKKMKDLSFCHCVHDDSESIAVGNTRRLSIATSLNNVLKSTNNSHFHAIHVFEKGGPMENLMDKLCSQPSILKVLDIQGTSLNHIPKNLGSLFHLRYINLSYTNVQTLPKSVGELKNLETLDLRETLVHELPHEINKLEKLRNLLVCHSNYEGNYSLLGTTGGRMQKGIKNMTSLQNLYDVEVDHGGVYLIQEMKMLRQLRRLGLRRVRREHGNALCAAVAEMKHLEHLNICAISEDEILDLNCISSPPQLLRLHLKARLQKLPDWIPELECLVKVRLSFSMLKDNPLQSLKNMPNLVSLCLWDNCYDGEIFHFQNGGFLKLMTLNLRCLNKVNSIVIDHGNLLSLEHLTLEKIPQLKEVPFGIKLMHKLKDIHITDMPAEFVESIDPDKGQDYSIIKHVPLVFIRHSHGPNLFDYDIRTIHSSSKEL
ncbi:putative P-loop containing nucleoside triphosphate hydrolase, leucine-rich repeat domain, L [Medicago truncatula]|uniref:Putative P-loop containing nucleoside triphosphate hydrolase, leucine-rich repeat domain, L n=1 Tax=Medicago truncatula TaxID=3880 RepID=A0A396IL84_MEDTR|nr:putative P-loop containing nucleoside triphosphate hydrolase, leucine-rich repeat domain, L [Medicago truncatula]